MRGSYFLKLLDAKFENFRWRVVLFQAFGPYIRPFSLEGRDLGDCAERVARGVRHHLELTIVKQNIVIIVVILTTRTISERPDTLRADLFQALSRGSVDMTRAVWSKPPSALRRKLQTWRCLGLKQPNTVTKMLSCRQTT